MSCKERTSRPGKRALFLILSVMLAGCSHASWTGPNADGTEIGELSATKRVTNLAVTKFASRRAGKDHTDISSRDVSSDEDARLAKHIVICRGCLDKPKAGEDDAFAAMMSHRALLASPPSSSPDVASFEEQRN